MKKNRNILLPLSLFFLLFSISKLFAQESSIISENSALIREQLNPFSILSSYFKPTLGNFSNILRYIFSSYALFKIAKEMKSEKAWLAWIPILDLLLICKLVGVSIKWVLGVVVLFLGWFLVAFFELNIIIFLVFAILALILSSAISLTIYSKLAEKRGYHGIFVFVFLIPYIGPFLYYYLLAWKPQEPIEKTKK